MTKRAIIFDFGGVITKTLDFQPRHNWDDRLNLPHGSVEGVVHGSECWIKAQVGTITLTEYWDDVAQQLDLSSTEVEQLADDFYKGDKLNTNLVEYIKTLKSEGHPIALLSNFGMMLETMLQDLNIQQLFDPCIISAQIGVMKPDPRAYEIVLERLNMPPEHCIFIDDTKRNIDAANKLGIHGILFKSEQELKTTLGSLLIAKD